MTRFSSHFRNPWFVSLAIALLAAAALGMGPRGAAADEPVDFDLHIMPALTRMGCNAGSCHGSAAGRGGFRLSLFGSRPADDFMAITLAERGRRIDGAEPEQSLLLRKPGGELEHGGGHLFDLDDEVGQLIAAWINEGASRQPGAALTRLRAEPPAIRLDAPGEAVPFQLVAEFDDGVARQVTDWAIVTPQDRSAVEVDLAGNRIRALRPGHHVLIARYLSEAIPIEVIVPVGGQPREATPNDAGPVHPIDRHIHSRLRELALAPGSNADDSALIRRLTLDLTGRLPAPARVDAFIADADGGKRERLVRELMKSDAFVDYWTFLLARQFRNRAQPNDEQGARAFHGWLRRQVADHRPWNELVRELLLARGDSHEPGPANFFRVTADARLQTELVTESLLGVQLRCANCHDHPLDRWTQDDYHSLAAVFAQVRQARIVTANPGGENIHPRTGEPAVPAIPGVEADPHRPADREAFADWVIDPENPWFARAIVNRLWSHLMGRGLVEPVDDLRSTNPGTHPDLLAELADDFVAHGYDLRHTIFQICTSETYAGRAEPAGEHPLSHRYYAAATPRFLSPPVLLDAISDVTGIREKWAGGKEMNRAIELFNPQTESPALDVLGRCPTAGSCETGGMESETGIPRQLHFLNGDLLNARLRNERGRLARHLAEDHADREIIDDFYRFALARRPTESEWSFWQTELAQALDRDSRQAVLEDFVWSLLSSLEFQTNH